MTTDHEWAVEEQSKIELLKKRMNPSSQLKYGRQIAELEAMLELLDKPASEVPKKLKTRVEKKIVEIVTGLRASTLGSKPNMETIPEEHAQMAKLIKASTFMSDMQDTEKGIIAAREYINGDPDDTTAEGFKTADTRGFEIDEDLTRMTGPKGQERGMVFVNPKTKQVKVVFRGTKFRADKNVDPYTGMNPIRRLRNIVPVPDAHTAEDLQLDYDIITTGRNWNPFSSTRNLNAQIRHPQIDTAEQVLRDAKAKYPEFEVKGGGYSLGGNTIITAGNNTNTDTITFNPHTAGRNILDGTTHPRNIKHQIYRTNKDIPSLFGGAHKLEYPDNYDIGIIPVHETNSREFNIRDPKTYSGLNDAHKLNNFYLRSGNAESLERQRAISDAGTEYMDSLNKGGSMRKLDGIIKFHEKYGALPEAQSDPDQYELAEAKRRQQQAQPDDSGRELIDEPKAPPRPSTEPDPSTNIFMESTTSELDEQLAGLEQYAERLPPTPKTSVKPKSELKKLRAKLDTLNAELGDETPEQYAGEYQYELESSMGTPAEAKIRQSGMKRRQQHAERQSIREDLGLVPRQEEIKPSFHETRPTARGVLRKSPDLYQPIHRRQEREPESDIDDLASQLREVGEDIDYTPQVSPEELAERMRRLTSSDEPSIPTERQGEGWFSKMARQWGMSTDDNNKHLYKKALEYGGNDEAGKNQLKLSEKETAGYDEDLGASVSDDFIKQYTQASPDEREQMKMRNDSETDLLKDSFDNVGNHPIEGTAGILGDTTKTFGQAFGEAGKEVLSAKGVGGAAAGMFTGYLIHKGFSKWVDPDKKLDKKVWHGDDMAESTLNGAILGKAMGQGFGYGGLIGLGSAAVGLGVEEGSDWALEKAGVSDKVAEGVGAGLGGASAGGLAVGLGIAASGAGAGAEAGAFAGPAGIAVGALVGAGLGVASHYLAPYVHFPWDDDTPEEKAAKRADYLKKQAVKDSTWWRSGNKNFD